ncbi:MAG: 2-hydroxyacyl-CoA dehydratase [Deltaproteobacteria bacterium]|nr:2-hydroxyacyl-CoA dehydratase [Deltaproteobacteria bacterium]
MPMTQTEEARQTYLKSVIQGVVKGLEKITGQAITSDSLAEAANLYGRIRALQRQLYDIRRSRPGLMKNHDFYRAIKAGFFLPAAVYHHMLEDLIEGLEKIPASVSNRPKLLLSGLVFDPIAIYGILDDLDVHVIDDDFANGWRTVSKKDLDVGNLVEGVTEFLFHPAPCCCIYNPDNDRHAYLVDKVRHAKADGVLFWYIKFCEPDAFDRPQLTNRLKEEGIPTAFIDVELSMTGFDAVKTRINAFCEILEG